MDQIFNKLSQLLVFFGATKQIVFFFAITALGVVSKVYRGFVYQKASLGKEACGMAARLTSHTSTFVELKDNAHGISEERLLRRFKRIFEHNKEIDDAEIRRLVSFIYSRMAKHDKDGIDVQDFSQACTHGEALHFKTLVELFDADRKKGILERTFAGPTIRKLFQSDKDLFNENRAAECERIDMSKSTTAAFQPGYVAAPVKAIPVANAEDTSDSSARGEHVKNIFPLNEASTHTQSERVLFCDANAFPFCSSHVRPLGPNICNLLKREASETIICSPQFATRSDKELFEVKVDHSILAPCLDPASPTCSLSPDKSGISGVPAGDGNAN